MYISMYIFHDLQLTRFWCDFQKIFGHLKITLNKDWLNRVSRLKLTKVVMKCRADYGIRNSWEPTLFSGFSIWEKRLFTLNEKFHEGFESHALHQFWRF